MVLVEIQTYKLQVSICIKLYTFLHCIMYSILLIGLHYHSIQMYFGDSYNTSISVSSTNQHQESRIKNLFILLSLANHARRFILKTQKWKGMTWFTCTALKQPKVI